MRLNLFNKGLFTRLAPHLIPQSFGTTFHNIDNSVGHFKAEKDVTITGISGALDYGYYFETENEWIFAAQKQDYALLGDKLYISDRTTQPKKRYSEGVYHNLGISAPVETTPIVTTITQGPELVTRLTMTEGTSGNLPSGSVVQYALVNVDSNGQGNFDFGIDLGIISINSSRQVRRSGILSEHVHQLVLGASTTSVTLSCTDTNFASSVKVYRFFDGYWRLVGTLTSTSDTLDDTIYDISSAAEVDVSSIKLNGVIRYALTYYNSSDGSESAPLLLDEIDLGYASVSLTNLPVSSDAQVDKKRIYRIGNTLTDFVKLGEIDNATTSFVDDTQDSSIVNIEIMDSSLFNTAPVGLKYLVEAYAMLFGAVGDILRYTPIGKPDAWPELYFLKFPEEITGLAPVQLGVIVFTDNQMFLVTGTGPNSLVQQFITADQGCVNHDTIQVVQGTAIWLSKDGICSSPGNAPTVLTKDALGKYSPDSVHAVVYDEQYFLHLTDNSTLIWDYRYNNSSTVGSTQFTLKTLDVSMTSLVVANDALYGLYNGSVYSFYTGSTLTAKYKSGQLFAGSLAEEKFIDRLEGYGTDNIEIKIYVNGTLANTFNLTETGPFLFKIAKEYSRYNYLELEVTGTGELLELSFIDENAHE